MKGRRRIFWLGLAMALAAAAYYSFPATPGIEFRTKPLPTPAPQSSGTPLPPGNRGGSPGTGADAFLPEVGDRLGDFVVAEVASSPHGFSVGYAGTTTVTGRVIFDESAGGYCFAVAAADGGTLPQNGGERAAAQFCFDDQESLPASLKRLAGTARRASVEIADLAEEYYGIAVSNTARLVRVVGP